MKLHELKNEEANWLASENFDLMVNQEPNQNLYIHKGVLKYFNGYFCIDKVKQN